MISPERERNGETESETVSSRLPSLVTRKVS